MSALLCKKRTLSSFTFLYRVIEGIKSFAHQDREWKSDPELYENSCLMSQVGLSPNESWLTAKQEFSKKPEGNGRSLPSLRMPTWFRNTNAIESQGFILPTFSH